MDKKKTLNLVKYGLLILGLVFFVLIFVLSDAKYAAFGYYEFMAFAFIGVFLLTLVENKIANRIGLGLVIALTVVCFIYGIDDGGDTTNIMALCSSIMLILHFATYAVEYFITSEPQKPAEEDKPTE